VGKYIPVEPEKWAEMVKALALVKEMDKTINASQAECRRLKEKSECQAECLEAFDKENARLKAEVVRLRKAGDDLVLHVEWRNVVFTSSHAFTFKEVIPDCRCSLHKFDKVIEAWNAAKEGKQS
jgi:hypothetical protein